MAFSSNPLYEFGPFQLDAQKRQLLRDGRLVPLTAKAMDVLIVLIQKAGEVVPRQELVEAVWPDSFVEDANLTQNTFLLRKALGETAHNRNYIVTVPGKGYVFTGAVREVCLGNKLEFPKAASRASSVGQNTNAEYKEPSTGSGPSDPAILSSSEALEPAIPGTQEDANSSHSIASHRSQPVNTPNSTNGAASSGSSAFMTFGTRVAAVVLLLAVALAYPVWRYVRQVRHTTAPRKVIAVLPFVNLTGDSSQDYFSEGLTEEMIMKVGRIDPEHLGVIAKSSVLRYKNSPEKLSEIRQELGADYVLTGSVRRDSERVRIAAQLIEMNHQTQLWGEEYDRELTSLVALQNTIAREIAGQIELTLAEQKRGPSKRQPRLSPDAFGAYDLYLQGRYFWNKRTADGFNHAISCFQRAIAKDPSYARAYAGLADSYVLLSSYGFVPASEVIPKARAAAEHALALDDTLAEAHTSLALIAQNYDWDWRTAEKEYRRAIQLDPNYATAHHWYAEHLAMEGKFDEAFPEIERARQLDPLSLIIATDHGAMLYFSGQYDRAIQQFRTVLAMEPNFSRAHLLQLAYIQQKRYAEALSDAEGWQAAQGTPWYLASLTYIYGRSGQPKKAKQTLEKLKRGYARLQIDPAPMAVAQIGANNNDEAIAWLQKACAQHSSALIALKVDPIYDPLRGDPRFQELLRRIGLSPNRIDRVAQLSEEKSDN